MYKSVYKNNKLKHYLTEADEKVWFYVERDEDEPSESALYRIRHDGEMQYREQLGNKRWIDAPLFVSYLQDALLEEINLEEAKEIATQIGLEFVE